MARTKGSINKNIHFKTREAFDIHLLYDEKKLLSGENPPAFWFQRLIELSNNPPYVIALRITKRQARITNTQPSSWIDVR